MINKSNPALEPYKKAPILNKKILIKVVWKKVTCFLQT